MTKVDVFLYSLSGCTSFIFLFFFWSQQVPPIGYTVVKFKLRPQIITLGEPQSFLQCLLFFVQLKETR